MTTTRDPVASSLQSIDHPKLRCVGRYSTGAGATYYPISWDDARRDAAWAAKYLSGSGVRAGSFVIVVSTGHEAPWYGPVLDALYGLKATVCPLEPAPYELGRAEMFFGRFPVSFVLGLDKHIAAALDTTVGLARALEGVRLIAARPDALSLLQEKGIPAGPLLPLGPALGLPCTTPGVFHVNEAEWILEGESGQLRISAAVAREHRPAGELIVDRAEVLPRSCRCSHGTYGIRLVK